MSVKSVALSLALVLSGVSAASAEPISVLGISWKNSHKEMSDILTTRGFACKDVAASVMQCEVPSNKQQFVIVSGSAIFVECASLGICDLPVQTVTTRFEETGKVNVMIPRLGSRNGVIYSETCGTGPEGDFACFELSADLGRVARLVVYKGEYGGKLTFD